MSENKCILSDLEMKTIEFVFNSFAAIINKTTNKKSNFDYFLMRIKRLNEMAKTVELMGDSEK